MNPIVFALRHPYTVLVCVSAVLIGSVLAMTRSKVDIFPNLNQPVIYVCQPYGGMSPEQMEGLLTAYYESHFLYVNGIEHVESKNIQSMALLKLYFHPGIDMAEAMAETVAAVNRSRFMMPPGTVPPFVTRLDAGSASVGYLVLSSDQLSIKDIQDLATLRVRPMFASVPGVSSPPAFGGNQRAVVVSLDADKLRAQGLTAEQVTEAVSQGNAVTPSGNLRVGDRNFLVKTNAMVGSNLREELGRVPVKSGESPVFLRDVATIEDASDITSGYVLVDGRRSVYLLVTKRSDASTISVVNELNKALPKMREAAPEIDIQFVFDQSPLVKAAMWGVALEGFLGALFTGLMVLIFLRDWRSVIVVVLNIPLALLTSVLALWICGQTINLMSLGGLALAVGILVDEATVEVENIHTQMDKCNNLARAVRRGNQETAVPRLLAMLCILSVFIPSFFMQGAARELFVPLALAVGFSMIASYVLSSTFVPVACIWLLKAPEHGHSHTAWPRWFLALQSVYGRGVRLVIQRRWVVVPAYFLLAVGSVVLLLQFLGTSIFPQTDQGLFQLRMRAPSGTRIERTEELARELSRLIREEAGPGNVQATVGYVGMFPTNYPIQAVHQWTSGPEELLLKVSLAKHHSTNLKTLKARLREVLPVKLRAWLMDRWAEEGVPESERLQRAQGLRLSFEPGDLINEVMSFGARTAVEVQISGSNMENNVAHANKIFAKLQQVPGLRDLQFTQAQDYPTVDVTIDRERAAMMELSAKQVGQALIPATASSRYMNPMYWRDPKSGQAYIVQVQIPPPLMTSTTEMQQIPVRGANGYHSDHPTPTILLRDVAQTRETTTAEQIDRYNMRRLISITGNLDGEDLGQVGRDVRAAIQAAGAPPKGVNVDLRGQLVTLDEIITNLTIGLSMAVLAVFLLLTAYYQSIRLAVAAVAATPATLVGALGLLYLTQTTINLQSFMGGIMAIGVAVANAILLVTFAERSRLLCHSALQGAQDAGMTRLRPILMTSCAMIAGMLPMALGFGEGGDQTAPLGRAVVGGVLGSTLVTLLILPAVFAIIQGRTSTVSPSLDPDDPASPYYDQAPEQQ